MVLGLTELSQIDSLFGYFMDITVSDIIFLRFRLNFSSFSLPVIGLPSFLNMQYETGRHTSSIMIQNLNPPPPPYFTNV